MKASCSTIVPCVEILLLVPFILLSQLGCESEQGRKAESSRSANARKTMLEYYTTQAIMTDPGPYADLYEGLPADPSELCRVVQGNLLHIFHAQRYGVELSDEKKAEVEIHTVADMLARAKEMDERPILSPRGPAKRVVGNCRDFSVFLCSLLRHKGIPARVRCGFGTYFTPGRYEDHWICEYWSSSDERWVKVDPQIDSVLTLAFTIEFNPFDIPSGKFFAAGEMWKLCRTGQVDPDLCGIWNLKGLWFVKDNVLRDFMALNKVELLPWDSNEFMKQSEEATEEQYAFVDSIAELLSKDEEAFSELRSLYESDPALRMPSEWKP